MEVYTSKNDLIKELNPVIFQDSDEEDEEPSRDNSPYYSKPLSDIAESRKKNMINANTKLEVFLKPDDKKENHDQILEQCNCVIS